MENFKIVVFSIVVLGIFQVTSAADYCTQNLCNGKPHIACNNNGGFASSCPSNAKIIQLSTQLRNMIVNKHNKLRNKMAKGFSKFPPAARMATMRWHPELAKMAELNVRQCAMKHDQCRNTAQFRYSGQNLAQTSSTGSLQLEKTVRDQIQSWFDEYKYTPLDRIRSFRPLTNGKQIGHFTSMIQDKSTHIGCAVLRLTISGNSYIFTACNYAFTNVGNKPVYVSGKSASQCKKGTNPKYPSLCSTSESYLLKP